MMLPSFLAPQIDLLDLNGALHRLSPPGALGRLAPPLVLLARGFCTFQTIDTKALSKRDARQAAKLHAISASPYARAGHVIAASHNRMGIWFWDADRVEALLARHPRRRVYILRPESMAQPAGDGLRLVKLSQGYEAQAWEGGALTASAWRRDRYTPDAWLKFARAAGSGAALEPPPAQTLPVSLSRPGLLGLDRPPGRAQMVQAALATAAAALVLSTVFSGAQALRLQRETDATRERAAALGSGDVDPAEAAERRLLEAELRPFTEVAEETNALSAAEVVIGITALYELTPSRLRIEEGEVELTLPYEALERAAELTPEFAASGYFTDIRPRSNPEARELIYRMTVRPGMPPLSEGG